MGVDKSQLYIYNYYLSYNGYSSYYGPIYMYLTFYAANYNEAYSIFYSYTNLLSTTSFNTYLATTRVQYNATDLTNTYSSYIYSYGVSQNSAQKSTQFTQTSQLYYSKQSVVWSTMSGWTKDGMISAESASVWDSFINWNASGTFSYTDGQYYITATENDFYSSSAATVYDNEFYVFVNGGYGASSVYDW